jgi:hypothetical protein
VRIVLCVLALSVVAGCHSSGAPYFRPTMPTEPRLDVRCVELPSDGDPEAPALNARLSGLYGEGYRVAWTAASRRTFLGITTSTGVLYCLERPGAGEPRKAARTGPDDEERALHSLYMAALRQAQSGEGFSPDSVPSGKDAASLRKRTAFMLGVEHATDKTPPFTLPMLMEHLRRTVK